VAPGAARASAPLPACTYADVLAADVAPADWQRTLLDTTYRLPASYVPPDLVPVGHAGLLGYGTVRSFVISDLRALARAAAAAGAPLYVQSAYRSYGTQIVTFNRWVSVFGRQAALLGSARPGHSEHQLGVTIDFRSVGGPDPWISDWAKTRAGAWMQANAWRFGFVMSYPRNASPSKTCYRYEAWHYRYTGRPIAASIHASGISLREYLWAQLQMGRDAATSPQAPRVTAPAASDQTAPEQITSSDLAAPGVNAATADGDPAATIVDPATLAPPAVALLLATVLLVVFPVGQLGEWRAGRARLHVKRSARRTSPFPG
jgi:D-alanyl-D-alanine carboxypeptidase